MKTTIYFAYVAISLTIMVACRENASTPTTDEIVGDHTAGELAEKVRQGAYLVQIAGCSDCHTPLKMTPQGPAPDMDRFLSGHPAEVGLPPVDPAVGKDYVLFNMTNTAAVGPWGTSFSANLTPDESGIGTWTEEQFSRALREGKSKGMENGRPLLPPMPWPNYQQLADEDLSAIFAYLQSIKPVKNVVPAPIAPMAMSGM
ncbi:MAG: c-type cytochrome [Saprospiraceae bacterium]|nr:c-type cytochrome [Lewinella sp.]